MTATSDRARVLRTPRAAGAAGVLAALLLAAVLMLVRLALPSAPSAATEAWVQASYRRQALHAALVLLPFAGIFFLWFMGAVRDHMPGEENRFFATLFLGSGLLFIATALVAGAVAGGLLAMSVNSAADGAGQLWTYGHTTLVLLVGYAMRMAAVFALSTTSIGRGLRIFPRWLAWLGYLAAIVLLFVVSTVPWSELVFPIWMLFASVYILAKSFGPMR